jgi:hypothetical protein
MSLHQLHHQENPMKICLNYRWLLALWVLVWVESWIVDQLDCHHGRIMESLYHGIQPPYKRGKTDELDVFLTTDAGRASKIDDRKD